MSRDLMQTLRAGVPVTLLIDLFCGEALDSADILRREAATDMTVGDATTGW